MGDVLTAIMRWLHIASVTTLIGGMFYASVVMMGAAAALAPEAAATLSEKAAERFRPLMWLAIAALILSGAYNLLISRGHSSRYLLLLGIKLLLVLHVFASAILAVRPHNPRRTRQMTGAFVSGLIAILIANYLRRIF